VIKHLKNLTATGGLKMKYYRVSFRVSPEVDEKFGRFITFYAKDAIEEIVNSFDKIKKVPVEIADDFHRNAKRVVGVYVSEDVYRKWRSIPWCFKKQAQYLINQKLLEMKEKEDNYG
jgi:hypothetical protein